MTKARQLADLLDASGDVSVGALDNVPPNTALVDSSDNTVLDTSTGDLVMAANASIRSGSDLLMNRSDADNEVRLGSGNASDSIVFYAGGGGVEKAKLDPSGNFSITGDLTVAGDIIGGGKVLQVVQGYTSAKAYITSSGYVWQDAATITPTSTSSKILVMFNLAFGRINLNGGLKLIRNDAYFMPNLGGAYLGGATAAQGAFNTADDGLTPQHDYSIGMYPVSYLDSPSSTSPQSYGVYMYFGGTGYVPFNRQYNDNGGYACSTVTLMEIAG